MFETKYNSDSFHTSTNNSSSSSNSSNFGNFDNFPKFSSLITPESLMSSSTSSSNFSFNPSSIIDRVPDISHGFGPCFSKTSIRNPNDSNDKLAIDNKKRKLDDLYCTLKDDINAKSSQNWKKYKNDKPTIAVKFKDDTVKYYHRFCFETGPQYFRSLVECIKDESKDYIDFTGKSQFSMQILLDILCNDDDGLRCNYTFEESIELFKNSHACDLTDFTTYIERYIMENYCNDNKYISKIVDLSNSCVIYDDIYYHIVENIKTKFRLCFNNDQKDISCTNNITITIKDDIIKHKCCHINKGIDIDIKNCVSFKARKTYRYCCLHRQVDQFPQELIVHNDLEGKKRIKLREEFENLHPFLKTKLLDEIMINKIYAK